MIFLVVVISLFSSIRSNSVTTRGFPSFSKRRRDISFTFVTTLLIVEQPDTDSRFYLERR